MTRIRKQAYLLLTLFGLAFFLGSDFFYGTGDCDYVLCLDEWPILAFPILIGIGILIYGSVWLYRVGKAGAEAERAKIRCLHCGEKWWREDFMGRRFCLACQRYFK